MRWLVAATLLRHGAPSPPCWVRITHPADGADVALDGGGLPLGFRVGGAVDGLDVCVQLTNKRVSYESFTHCGAASAREFVLSGFLPGVWRAKAYLAASPGPAGLRRGACPTCSPTTTAWTPGGASKRRAGRCGRARATSGVGSRRGGSGEPILL